MTEPTRYNSAEDRPARSQHVGAPISSRMATRRRARKRAALKSWSLNGRASTGLNGCGVRSASIAAGLVDGLSRFVSFIRLHRYSFVFLRTTRNSWTKPAAAPRSSPGMKIQCWWSRRSSPTPAIHPTQVAQGMRRASWTRLSTCTRDCKAPSFFRAAGWRAAAWRVFAGGRFEMSSGV